MYKLFSDHTFKDETLVDPVTLYNFFKPNGLTSYYPDYIHLFKNLWRRLINEDKGGKEHILSFFVNMKKNKHINAIKTVLFLSKHLQNLK